jgi:hypothetical protein
MTKRAVCHERLTYAAVSALALQLTVTRSATASLRDVGRNKNGPARASCIGSSAVDDTDEAYTR